MASQYILEPLIRTPRRVQLAEWTTWMFTAERCVASFEIDDILILTMFFGVDHRKTSDIPILFETTIYCENDLGSIKKYSTWKEAATGHQHIVDVVLQRLKRTEMIGVKEIKKDLQSAFQERIAAKIIQLRKQCPEAYSGF